MSGSGQVTLGRQQDVDDLAVLVDGPVEISPCASDLHIGLVDERPVTGAWRHGRAASMNSRGESLNPPVDGDVIHGDAALGKQLLNVAVGQAVPQVPADRDRDHLPRKPEAYKIGAVPGAVTGPVSGLHARPTRQCLRPHRQAQPHAD